MAAKRHKLNQVLSVGVRLQKQRCAMLRAVAKKDSTFYDVPIMFFSATWRKNMLDLFPRTPSIPLAEALQRFGDADLVSWLEQNKDSDDPTVSHLWWTRQRELERSLYPDLKSGALVATAFEEPLSSSSQRTRISADVWKLLTFDAKRGTASFRGLSVFAIEVQEDEWLGRIYGIKANRRQMPRSSDATGAPALEELSVCLSEDLSLLSIGDNDWPLTGDIQQHIIKQLVDAYPSGQSLKTTKVLAEAGSNSDAIAKAFNKSPNWPTLRRYIKVGGGNCQLVTLPIEDADLEEDRKGSDGRS